MSAALEISIDSAALRTLHERLERLAGALGEPPLDALGAAVASQAQRRIEAGGPAPDGSAWQPWSEEYAATRHANQSLLRAEGDLLASIQHAVDGDVAEIGTNLVYGAAQQFGLDERNLPARAFLGLSAADLAELDEIVGDWLSEAGRVA